MTFVYKCSISRMGGGEELYSVTVDGKQTKNGAPIADADMESFWGSMGATIDAVVAAKKAGFDQVRIYYTKTCQPIYQFEVRTRDGKERKFSIYGRPAQGAELEKGEADKILPQMYVDLFNYAVAGG